ncbi:meteorin-like protein [Hippocampus zosterae]|uniref:meteorin-like protein n=1 Tax=Hippocampus zosterae TaxID=109293 RepID=UPI00223E8B4E|nr:meteorin-like protein [Hippocampus zosterae]
MLSQRLLASLWLPLVVVLLSRCRTSLCQYSSDQCSWKGSGLTHEGHTRDVEQVYLRCAQGSLEWLYPTGAIIVNLRPNIASPAAARLSVCIKPAADSSGSNIYLDLNGRLRLLLREEDQAPAKVHCFGILEGALFIEAVPRADISRRITAFQYELVADGLKANDSSLGAPCQPCSDAEVLLAVCTKDFVARGVIRGVQEEEEEDRWSVSVDISRLHRQKTQVFVPGGPRARRWSGRIMMPLRCAIKPGEGDFLFTGTLRFGEAWMGCAPRYKDFLRLYREAERLRSNPCHVDTD